MCPTPTTLAAEVAAYDAVGVYGDAGAPSVDGRSTPTCSPAVRRRRHGHLARLSSRTGRSGAGSPTLSEVAAGVVDVVLELLDQRVDAVELALAAQEVGELHLGRLAVQVAVEVEQVRLEQ